MRRIILFLLLVFFLLSLYAWKANFCFNPDEVFYYKSSQTLSEPGNIYAPKYYEEHRFQKPPLFYLAVFSSYKFFGVNWFSARLVTILSSVLVLIMTYLLGLKMFGREKAFFGTAVTATTVLFFRFGRVVLPEMTLILFITGALYFAYLAISGKRRGFFYLSFVFMAVGTLVKGPIAFLLPGVVILLFGIIKRKETPQVSVPWIQGFLIVLGASTGKVFWITCGALRSLKGWRIDQVSGVSGSTRGTIFKKHLSTYRLR